MQVSIHHRDFQGSCDSFSDVDRGVEVDAIDSGHFSTVSAQSKRSVASKLARSVTRGRDKEPEDELYHLLATDETRRVRVLRVILVLAMIAVAALICALVYDRSKRDEEEAFEAEFDDLAQRLVEGFHANAKLRLQALDQLSVAITSFAIHSHQSFPTVTVYDYEAMATPLLATVGAHSVGFSPIVTDATRQEWEEYTVNHSFPWLYQSLAYQEDFRRTHNTTVGRVDGRESGRRSLEELILIDEQETQNTSMATTALRFTENGQANKIFRFGTPAEAEVLNSRFVVENEGTGYYVPIWQSAPATPASVQDVNYNLLDEAQPGEISKAIQEAVNEKSAVFAGVWNVRADGTINMDDDFDYRVVPAASILYPIFNQTAGEKEVAAILYLDLEFGPYFDSVLPPKAKDIICVVSTPCGQAFSYLIDGESATYLGTEKEHDPKYDSARVSALMTDFLLYGTAYTGVPISENFCPWTLDVYPTQELEDKFVTSKPIYYTLAVLGIFLFTCFMFALLDYSQEKRQKKVMKNAVKADQVVSELFPKEFKGRLYDAKTNDEANDPPPQVSTNLLIRPLNTTLQAINPINALVAIHQNNPFLASNNNLKLYNLEEEPAAPSADGDLPPPMANLYKECTVFFGDIAGFTAWSSSRTPADVFTLLESLYGAFDKLAAKHNVFKIETIGDCYVAATGLPVEQPNHAFLMAKFARDILVKTGRLTLEMEKALGPGTSELAMRVGLHSGPVTAGILRGEKARFQLFGDTVNTAARMESNGQKHCIHASEETANYLIAMGKGHFVIPREDKIHAKGKGELQTYWLKPVSGGSRTGDNSHVSSNTESHTNLEYDEDIEVVNIVSAIKNFPGSDSAKFDWATENCKRIGWVADLLAGELKAVDSERGGNGEGNIGNGVDIWQNKSVLEDSGVDDLKGYLCKASIVNEESPVRQKAFSAEVAGQLYRFVAKVAFLCKASSFHNFEHSCLQIMSANRLLKQLQATSGGEFECSAVAWLAVLFASLIHDLKGQQSTSPEGSGKHALYAAWDILNAKDFEKLRLCMCANELELRCFWRLISMLVSLSEDSVSSEAVQRWDEAFGECDCEASEKQEKQVLATLEHVIILAQATHVLQHWDNYVKWSMGLYEERCQGEYSDDAASTWYQRELDFFDQTIIPAAERVEKAQVLGALGKEILLYAQQNRREWETTGKELAFNFCSNKESEGTSETPIHDTSVDEHKQALDSLIDEQHGVSDNPLRASVVEDQEGTDTGVEGHA